MVYQSQLCQTEIQDLPLVCELYTRRMGTKLLYRMTYNPETYSYLERIIQMLKDML